MDQNCHNHPPVIPTESNPIISKFSDICTMQWLPVAVRYYKINYDRNSLVERLTQLTFLSDSNFKADKNKTYSFYGDISSADFYLLNIQKEPETTTLLDGRILGLENEIYLKITHRLWEKTTTPVLFLLTIVLTSVTFFHAWLSQYLWYASINPTPGYLTKTYSSSLIPENPLAFVVVAAIGVMVFLYKKKLNEFQKQLHQSKAYFLKTFQATSINKTDLPLVFR